MKKFVSIMLLLAVCISFISCTLSKEDTPQTPNTTNEPVEETVIFKDTRCTVDCYFDSFEYWTERQPYPIVAELHLDMPDSWYPKEDIINMYLLGVDVNGSFGIGSLYSIPDTFVLDENALAVACVHNFFWSTPEYTGGTNAEGYEYALFDLIFENGQFGEFYQACALIKIPDKYLLRMDFIGPSDREDQFLHLLDSFMCTIDQ